MMKIVLKPHAGDIVVVGDVLFEVLECCTCIFVVVNLLGLYQIFLKKTRHSGLLVCALGMATVDRGIKPENIKTTVPCNQRLYLCIDGSFCNSKSKSQVVRLFLFEKKEFGVGLSGRKGRWLVPRARHATANANQIGSSK